MWWQLCLPPQQMRCLLRRQFGNGLYSMTIAFGMQC